MKKVFALLSILALITACGNTKDETGIVETDESIQGKVVQEEVVEPVAEEPEVAHIEPEPESQLEVTSQEVSEIPYEEPIVEPEPIKPVQREHFGNCTELRQVYPNGVPSDHPAYQPKMDRDKDNWACEK